MASRSPSTPVDSVWVNPKELALASDQLPRLAKALKRDKNELARRVTSNLDREFRISRGTCSRPRRRRSARWKFRACI